MTWLRSPHWEHSRSLWRIFKSPSFIHICSYSECISYSIKFFELIGSMHVYHILRKNLDQCFVNIFAQWKSFQLIDLIPDFTSYRGPGIKAINWNTFHWSKIFTKHWSRFLFKIRQSYRYVYSEDQSTFFTGETSGFFHVLVLCMG